MQQAAHSEDFLREIRRHPDDAVVRLIYADWLEEMGDSHAELIRLQCQLDAPAEADEDTENTAALRQRETELVASLERRCLEELEPLGVRQVRFRGGFVTAALVEGGRFLQHGRALQRWAPALRRVVWRRMPRDAADAVGRLMRSPFLDCLTELDLAGNGVSRSAVATLAATRRAGQLRMLRLDGTQLAGQGMQDLTDGALWSLESLGLSANELSAFDMRVLCRSERFASLTSLAIGRNAIADEGLRALSQWSRLDTLRELDLAANDIGPTGLRAVADSPFLTNLESLTLRGNSLHGEGVREISQASNFARLRSLDLGESGLDGHDTLRLLSSPYLRKLTQLDLSFNPLKEISPDLAAAPNWSPLRSLSLRATQLDGLGIRELLRNDPLGAIEALDLRDNPLIDVRSREALVERFAGRVRL